MGQGREDPKRRTFAILVEAVILGVSFCVFAILDIFDQLLCSLFRLLDSLLEGKAAAPCYCHANDPPLSASSLKHSDDDKEGGLGLGVDSWRRTSETILASHRRAGKRRLHLLSLHRVLSNPAAHGLDHVGHSPVRDCPRERQRAAGSRWTDCGCDICTSWVRSGPDLHVQVVDKDFAGAPGAEAENNVIFLHGFLASSRFWTSKVIPTLGEDVRSKYRMFAVDVLGFGESPKPSDCYYTLADHVNSLRQSVLLRYGVQKFHLVAHSMGCLVALALAAQCPSAVKSITFFAPPYFPAASAVTTAVETLRLMAPRRVWPPMAFGSAIMAWYEHLGRVVCLIICRNHRFWEPILSFLRSRTGGPSICSSSVTDFTKHTHHSAWHSFHNTICFGAYTADHSYQVLGLAGRRVRVFHGTLDAIIPVKQAELLERRHANVVFTPVLSADHSSLVSGREEQLCSDLAEEFRIGEGNSSPLCVSSQ